MRTYNYQCQYPKNAETIKRFDEYQLDLFYRKTHIFSFDVHVATAYLDVGLILVRNAYGKKLKRIGGI